MDNNNYLGKNVKILRNRMQLMKNYLQKLLEFQ